MRMSDWSSDVCSSDRRAHGVGRVTQVRSDQPQAKPAASLGELVSRLGKAPLLHQPGERFSYGFSTTVLGAMIEKVSGETLDAYFQTQARKSTRLNSSH